VLWRAGGGGALFGFDIDPGPEPTIDFYQGQILRLGSVEFEVRFTPGHTPGHCVLYVENLRAERSEPSGERSRSAGVCFCGDVIFAGSVGRTDLPGASWEQLENSIRTQIFTLPDQTRLLAGHGPETTVGEEKISNPFVGGV
jgi:hydroxyacylglutathione hydrolase